MGSDPRAGLDLRADSDPHAGSDLPADSDLRSRSAALFRSFQDRICSALAACENGASFRVDPWQRPDMRGGHGGGGESRVLSAGSVFEQAGVNFSEVHGTLPAEMAEKLTGNADDAPFYATGISLVVHPRSPLVPTVHANFRYLEVGTRSWFGGGADLTPYYLFAEDCRHFHAVWKKACDRHDPSAYARYKKWCDEYFFLPHRGETRGVGGIFFDYLGRDDAALVQPAFAFVTSLGPAVIEAYLPIVERRRLLPWTPPQRDFQLLRRGRYVEFNLLYDRGTLFGLRTGGRTESILMSLPPVAHWCYDPEIIAGTPEAELLDVLRAPREWI